MDKQVARLDERDVHSLALSYVPLALVLTNPHLEDDPIIYVNRAFEAVTGYSRASAIGRNCRFLQGPDTSRETVNHLREKVRAREEVTVDLLNYRADGAPFWNRLHVVPLLDEAGEVQFNMGVQRLLGSRREATIAGGSDDMPLREVTHRVKNHLAMVVSMIRTQSRAATTNPQQDFLNLARRVESLQLLYQEMSDNGVGSVSDEKVALGAYVTRVASAVSYLGSGGGIRTNVDVEFVESPLETAAQIGLILSEILTNAYQHAFSSRTHGLVEVTLRRRDGGIRLQVVDDGVGMPENRHWPESGSLGGRIVRSLVNGLDGHLSVDRLSAGTQVTLDIPLH